MLKDGVRVALKKGSQGEALSHHTQYRLIRRWINLTCYGTLSCVEIISAVLHVQLLERHISKCPDVTYCNMNREKGWMVIED